MSGRQPLPGFVNPITPEAYQANKASLEAAQARIAAWGAINEEGRKTHEELERALREKIREGELAKCACSTQFQQYLSNIAKTNA